MAAGETNITGHMEGVGMNTFAQRNTLLNVKAKSR